MIEQKDQVGSFDKTRAGCIYINRWRYQAITRIGFTSRYEFKAPSNVFFNDGIITRNWPGARAYVRLLILMYRQLCM